MDNQRRDFNKDAAQWDENPGRVKLAQDVGRSLLDAVAFGPQMDVLDFGCGTGLITLQIQPLVRSVTSVDTSQGMLDVLQNKLKKNDIANVKTRSLDLEKGGELEGRFHAIVSSMTLHHVPDTAALISRFFDHLEPGGVLALADLDPDKGLFHEDNKGVFHQGFDRKALAELYRKAGFEKIQDGTAAKVVKKTAEGTTNTFTVFLVVGYKK